MTKLLPYILLEKYIYILALEMASPGNQHCANCIGALSFHMHIEKGTQYTENGTAESSYGLMGQSFDRAHKISLSKRSGELCPPP